MATIIKTCLTCNKTYANNVVYIGNLDSKLFECPYCQTCDMLDSSSNPSISKYPLKRTSISSLLQQKFNDSTFFHNRVYHITSEKNIQSIEQDGLLPYSNLKTGEIEVVTGGNEDSLSLDKTLGLDKYIHLSFTKWCPMFHKKKKMGEKLCLLHISFDVLDQPGVLFCDRIATSNDAVFYDYLDFNAFDFEAVYNYIDWGTTEGQLRRQRAEKYEILVPYGISTDKILDVSPIS